MPVYESITRTVWDFQRAHWEKLREHLRNIDWASLLNEQEVDESVERFCRKIQTECEEHIPRKIISNSKTSHRWLDEECYEAIRRKCAASGTDEFGSAERDSSEVLKRAFLSYQNDLRERLSNLKSSSKEWWRLNRELLNRKCKPSSIPPLKDSRKQIVLAPIEKANLLAKTLKAKCILPERN